MASITLERVVSPMMSVQNGCACIKDDVKTAVVKFADDKGNRVSIAFDGRCDCKATGSGLEVHEVYGRYTDCPISFNGTQGGPVSDLQAMRLMRDALIAMDLG